MLINVADIEIVSLADLDLEKAAFGHGYYTHLVPKKIRGKDGVERIHWVNPDPGSKVKLKRVSHHRDGVEADHHKEIQATQEIDKKDLLRFSQGDKVVMTWGREKGREGVFRGAIAGPSPRVSIAFLNPKTKKHEAKVVNVNHIKLVHRADAETKKVIERKTVETTNLKGETILVDREDYEKYYKDRDKQKTTQARVAEEATRLAVGGAYARPDGRVLLIESKKAVGAAVNYDVTVLLPDGKKKGRATVDASRLSALVNEQKFERVPRAAALKKRKVYDDATGTWTAYKSETPYSDDLESGALHAKGHFAYSAAGVRVASKEDQAVARKILVEHWPSLEKTVAVRVAKYSAVSDGDVTPADILDGLVGAVASYEPLLDKAAGIAGRLRAYADSYAKNEAEKIHEREMTLVRDDFVNDSDTKVDPTPAVDKAAVKEALGDTNDIIASAFVSKHDAIALEEGLADEADMMSWLYEDKKILDIMQRWTGLGVYESTISKKEAAAELAGFAYNPKTMKPYAVSTIETILLPQELERIKTAFKAEGMAYPEFMHTLKGDVSLRNKLHRNRQAAPLHPKDESVAKVVREKIEAPAGNSEFAGHLIRNGVPLKYVPAVVQLGHRILTGNSVFTEYAKQLPRPVWESGSKALTSWFKEKFPPSVFSGKRGAAMGLSSRFDVESPIKLAIANEEKLKEAEKAAIAEAKHKKEMEKELSGSK